MIKGEVGGRAHHVQELLGGELWGLQPEAILDVAPNDPGELDEESIHLVRPGAWECQKILELGERDLGGVAAALPCPVSDPRPNRERSNRRPDDQRRDDERPDGPTRGLEGTQLSARRAELERSILRKNGRDLELELLRQELVRVFPLGRGRLTGSPVHELDQDRRDRLLSGTEGLEGVALTGDGPTLIVDTLRWSEVDDREAIERLAELRHQELDTRLGSDLEIEGQGVADQRERRRHAYGRLDRATLAGLLDRILTGGRKREKQEGESDRRSPHRRSLLSRIRKNRTSGSTTDPDASIWMKSIPEDRSRRSRERTRSLAVFWTSRRNSSEPVS
jgi:hypothetical protein